MRNIFDQYSQPENRLTHALVSALGEDTKLLRKFVKWITEATPPKRLKIVEQQLPGEYELAELDYEKKGLPDAWIHDDEEWSLVIESKVAAPLRRDQLKRHYRTAEKRGFVNVTVLAIDVSAPKKKLPDYVVFRSWREIYSWLSSQSNSSEWALRALRYMEVAERKWPAEGYLKEGTLTEFSGIPFDDNNPYSYGEAKRLIRLMMDELRQHPDLKQLINVKAPGRGAITGKSRAGVWDYLRLKRLDATAPHTSQPHLSMNMGREEMRAFLLVPNSAKGHFRRSIIDMGEDEFFEVMWEINRNMSKIVCSAKGAYPYASINQRRFPTRSSKAIIDGTINFDLRTAFSGKKGQKVKVQPEWLSAVYSMIANKRSHMEFGVGVSFPYEDCKKLKSTVVLDSLAASWLACKPLIDKML